MVDRVAKHKVGPEKKKRTMESVYARCDLSSESVYAL